MPTEPLSRRAMITAGAGALIGAGLLADAHAAAAQEPKPAQPRAGSKPDDGESLPPSQPVGIAIVGIGAYASE